VDGARYDIISIPGERVTLVTYRPGRNAVVKDAVRAADVRPEGGARCVSSARRDLCGWRLASALKSAVCDDGRGKA
jgi:hypothetical protein